MNTTAITLLKLTMKNPSKTDDLRDKLKIGNWQFNDHIKKLSVQGYILKKGKIVELQKSDKILLLSKLSKKTDIEKILRESNEIILSYLTEPITINNLILRTRLSKATVYRTLSDLESIEGFKKQESLSVKDGKKEHDVIVSIEPMTTFYDFAKLLHHDRVIRESKPTEQKTLFEETPHKISFDELKTHLWEAADVLRGSLDANEYRQPIMTLLYLKRLNDRFDEKQEEFRKQRKSEKWVNDPDRYELFIPESARWSEIVNTFENIGEKIDQVSYEIEHQDPANLEGVLTNTSYNDKRRYPDDVLLELVAHFNKKRLRNEDLENEDIFGQAYEYLLEQFADSAGKKAGEFFTPREVVELLVQLLRPKEGTMICDPTCGSGGMLIWSHKYVKEHGGNPDNLALHGQERNFGNYGMCKMNMLLHRIRKSKIVHENVLKTPLLLENGKLTKYDLVLANFPFSMDWDSSNAVNDSYGRFEFGIPPSKGKADFAFIQHMYSILNKNGKAAIICSQGILFRSGEEGKIRQNMIEEDVIEGIIALPSNLFYGTSIPACVLVLNKNKPKNRKNKIIFIYGTRDFEDLKKRDKLRTQDIKKIISAFNNFESDKQYCHIADFEEISENEFNLNVSRYVDTSIQKEEIDVQAEINELKAEEINNEKFESNVKNDLKELGFKI